MFLQKSQKIYLIEMKIEQIKKIKQNYPEITTVRHWTITIYM